MNTSDKLKALFDFQGFSKSEKLEGVINSTLASVENQLNETDLDMVSAAGTPDAEKNIPAMMVDMDKIKKLVDEKKK